MRYSCVKSRFRRSCPPQWPKVLGAAALGGAATLFLARNFFPSEKKIHHEIITNYAVGDDVFVRMMGNLLGPPLLKGNKVTAFENGDQIFPALLKAILAMIGNLILAPVAVLVIMYFVNQRRLGEFKANTARNLLLAITAAFALVLVINGVWGLFA